MGQQVTVIVQIAPAKCMSMLLMKIIAYFVGQIGMVIAHIAHLKNTNMEVVQINVCIAGQPERVTALMVHMVTMKNRSVQQITLRVCRSHKSVK